MTDLAPLPQADRRHSLLDDAQGLAYGTTMAAFGLVILTHLGLVTGQTAGLAVLISYATGWGFGPVFFAINLPFYWLGYRRMGLAFVIKTFIAVGTLSVLVTVLPRVITFEMVNPIFGAVLFGLEAGSALLALLVRDAQVVAISAIGSLVINLMIAMNHRRDRYVAT